MKPNFKALEGAKSCQGKGIRARYQKNDNPRFEASLTGGLARQMGIDMSQIHLEIDRSEHPLDVVERLASLRHWIFDRAEAELLRDRFLASAR